MQLSKRNLKLCPIAMTLWGVQRSCYYGKGDDLEAPAIWEPARALGGLSPSRIDYQQELAAEPLKGTQCQL